MTFLDAGILVKELWNAIKQLKNHKSLDMIRYRGVNRVVKY